MPLHATHSNACFMLLIKVTNFCTLAHPWQFRLVCGEYLLETCSPRLLFCLKEMTHQSCHCCRHASAQCLPSVVCPVSFLCNSRDVANTFCVDFQNSSPEVFYFQGVDNTWSLVEAHQILLASFRGLSQLKQCRQMDSNSLLHNQLMHSPC